MLDDRQPPVPLQELAEAVDEAASDDGFVGEPATDGGTTSDEGDPPDRSVAGDRRRRIAIELYHVHLPRLDDAGLVSFDPASKLVEDWRSNMLLDAV